MQRVCRPLVHLRVRGMGFKQVAAEIEDHVGFFYIIDIIVLPPYKFLGYPFPAFTYRCVVSDSPGTVKSKEILDYFAVRTFQTPVVKHEIFRAALIQQGFKTLYLVARDIAAVYQKV